MHEEINRAKRHKSISAESNETNETDHGRADGLERKGGCLMGHYFTES